MGWFRNNPSQEKYVEAAITVASNLYLHTITETNNTPIKLEFRLNDSRYRYLLFCLSTVFSAALAYDTKKRVKPEALFEGCMNFAKWSAIEMAEMYFGDPTSVDESIANAARYFEEFLQAWSRWPSLEMEKKNEDILTLISQMIHSTESDVDVTDADIKRLNELALDIDCRLPTMYSAFVELANR